MRSTATSCRVAFVVVGCLTCTAHAQTVFDANLRTQTWVRGLDRPTGLVFVDNGGALVTERTTGRVKLIRNRAVESTVLDLPVANGGSEQGLLGITLSPHFDSDRYVYLYYTASTQDGGAAFDNRVERHVWNGSSLTFDRHIVRMPADPGPNHNGGRMVFGPDNKLYVQMGDVNRNGRTQNYESSGELTRTGVIMRLQPYGKPVPNNPYFNPGAPTAPINDIWAHGVRNGFGLDFDPVSGFLWDTENGGTSFDEINLVHRGFNSGWEDVMGPSARNGGTPGEPVGTMANLGGASKYFDPKMSWLTPVAPTDVHFLRNGHLGNEYRGDLFVGALRNGAIFHFELSFNRRNLLLDGPLADQVADNTSTNRLGEQDQILFGTGFGTVTDIVTGPGGMYVLSLDGTLYRISRNPDAMITARLAEFSLASVPEPRAVGVVGLTGWVLLRRTTRRRRRRPRAPSCHRR